MSLDVVGFNPGDKVRAVWRNEIIFKHFCLLKLGVVLDRVLSLKETSGAASVGKRNT